MADCCAEGGAAGVVGDVRFVFEGGLLAVGGSAVLADDGVGVLDGEHPVQDSCLGD